MNEIEKLERWTVSGAHWRVRHRADDEVTISLITCTGGEEVERFTSRDKELLTWLGGRESDESDLTLAADLAWIAEGDTDELGPIR